MTHINQVKLVISRNINYKAEETTRAWNNKIKPKIENFKMFKHI